MRCGMYPMFLAQLCTVHIWLVAAGKEVSRRSLESEACVWAHEVPSLSLDPNHDQVPWTFLVVEYGLNPGIPDNVRVFPEEKPAVRDD